MKSLKSLLKIILALLLLLVLCIAAALLYFKFSGVSPISLILTQMAKRDYAWQCNSPLIQQSLNPKGSITWTKLQCQGTYHWNFVNTSAHADLLTFNIIDADLADANNFAKPTIGNALAKSPYRSPLSQQASTSANFVAGINGGYFRTKLHHRDENCLRRSPDRPIDGPNRIGDSLLIIDNHAYSTNCNGGPLSEAGRSSLIQDATTQQWRIERVKKDTVPTNAVNAIGAGPGLIQTIAGKAQIQITWEGILSTFEFSANAAVVLAKDKQNNPHMLFITVDGTDKESGMTATEMANFIYYKIPSLFSLQLVSAMSMDQGNSTTMFVKAAPNPIVSMTGGFHGDRSIYDGLFIGTASH